MYQSYKVRIQLFNFTYVCIWDENPSLHFEFEFPTFLELNSKHVYTSSHRIYRDKQEQTASVFTDELRHAPCLTISQIIHFPTDIGFLVILYFRWFLPLLLSSSEASLDYSRVIDICCPLTIQAVTWQVTPTHDSANSVEPQAGSAARLMPHYQSCLLSWKKKSKQNSSTFFPLLSTGHKNCFTGAKHPGPGGWDPDVESQWRA